MSFQFFPLALLQGTETLKVSRDFLRSAQRFSESIRLVEELELLSHRVNASIQFSDPEYYDKLNTFRQAHLESQPAIKLIASMDPLLPENRALLYNTRLNMHNDTKDPKGSLSVFTAFGEFEGGQIHYRDLGIKARFDAGDFNLARGRVAFHEIEPFSGQRISIPHFSHTSCWRALGLASLVNE
jgi:hypothetical protein